MTPPPAGLLPRVLRAPARTFPLSAFRFPLFLVPLSLFLAPPASAAFPWDKPKPPPEAAVLVLTQPAPPDPPPPGSIMEVPAERTLPARWRTTAGVSSEKGGNAGLPTLNASGSAQFDLEQLYALRQELRAHRVAVIDLRQEPHTFLNGAALAWGPAAALGPERTADAVTALEATWTRQLAARKFTDITRYAPGPLADQAAWIPIQLRLDIRDHDPESALIAEAGWGYFRIAAPDAPLPRDQDIDRFVEMVRLLDADIWLHFHCDTGGRRTALYLTLYDMMRNYVRANRDEILTRQRRLGDYPPVGKEARAARDALLARFFSYCWQAGPLFRRSWTSWSRANP